MALVRGERVSLVTAARVAADDVNAEGLTLVLRAVPRQALVKVCGQHARHQPITSTITAGGTVSFCQSFYLIAFYIVLNYLTDIIFYHNFVSFTACALFDLLVLLLLLLLLLLLRTIYNLI